MTDVPAKHFRALADEKSALTAESTVDRAGQQFSHNKEKGDACAAYEQMRIDVLRFESGRPEDLKRIRTFINDVSTKLETSGLLPSIQVASVRYENEEKSFLAASKNIRHKNVEELLVIQEKDPGIQLFEKSLELKREKQMSEKGSLHLLEATKKEYLKSHPFSWYANEKYPGFKPHSKIQADNKLENKDEISNIVIEPTTIKEATKQIIELKKHIANVHDNWDEATSLHDLAALQNMVGSSDAGKHFKQAIDKMSKDLPGQPAPEVKNKALAKAISDYADYLTEPKKTDAQSTPKILGRQRSEADAVFDHLLKIAPKARLSDLDLADIYRRKGENQIYIASTNNVHSPSSKPNYREGIESAQQSFSAGLKVIESNQSSDATAAKALMLGDRGFAAASEADKAGDQYAKSAELDYKQALKMWQNFRADQGHTNTREIEQRNALRDQAVAGVLANYIKLLMAEDRQPDAYLLKNQLQNILAKHQDARIK